MATTTTPKAAPDFTSQASDIARLLATARSIRDVCDRWQRDGREVAVLVLVAEELETQALRAAEALTGQTVDYSA